MNITTIFKVILGLMFSAIGIMKLSQPMEKLAQTLNWINDFSTLFVRILGGLELLIGLFLVTPLLLKSIPHSLSAYASIGVVLIMLGAIFTHFQRGEYSMIIMNVLLMVMGVFLACKYFYPA